MEAFVTVLKNILSPVAEISADFLELVGIVIIVLGSCRALVQIVQNLIKKKPFHTDIDLGRTLSLALEFKMGAEIIKTVIIHNLEELAILGVVILIRAALSFFIHLELRLKAGYNKPSEK